MNGLNADSKLGISGLSPIHSILPVQSTKGYFNTLVFKVPKVEL